VVIQPNKRHKWQIILISTIRAIKNNNIAKSLVVTPGLTTSPEQSLQITLSVNQVLEEKIWIALLSRHHVTNHRFAITANNYFLLILIA
jgi:hypothetical protein